MNALKNRGDHCHMGGNRASAPPARLIHISVWFHSDRLAALIAWMLVVRVDDLVKDRRPPKAAALRAVLDKIINTNRVLSKRSRPLSPPFNIYQCCIVEVSMT